jgi:hypothetical protein
VSGLGYRLVVGVAQAVLLPTDRAEASVLDSALALIRLLVAVISTSRTATTELLLIYC